MSTSDEYLSSGEDEKKQKAAKRTETILNARTAAITDRQLTDGARNLFTLLLDLSLDPTVNSARPGEIMISNTQLCERLYRSPRAIFGWTKELAFQRHVWVSKRGRPNMKPMNVFHITALQPRRQAGLEVANDGLWGNGYRRPDSPMPKGARGAFGKKRHLLLDQYGNPLNAQSAGNEPPTRTEHPLPPASFAVDPCTKYPCHPQNLRSDTAKLAGPTRTKRHLPPAQNDTYHPQETSDLKESLDGDSVSSDQLLSCLTAEKGFEGTNAEQFSGSTALKVDLEGEREFLQRLGEITGPKEIANWGGRWRNRYRENPGKAMRVLNELTCMHREGSIFRNAGACADDLWRRFV